MMTQQEMQAEEDRAIAEAKHWVAGQKPWVIMHLYLELCRNPSINTRDYLFQATNGIEINIKGFIDTWAQKLQDLSMVNGERIPDVVTVIRQWVENMSDEQLDKLAALPDPKFWITRYTSVSCGSMVLDVKERRRRAAELASREMSGGWGEFS